MRGVATSARIFKVVKTYSSHLSTNCLAKRAVGQITSVLRLKSAVHGGSAWSAAGLEPYLCLDLARPICPPLQPWKTKKAMELAILEQVVQFNHLRLLNPIGCISPTEAEANHYRQLANPVTPVAGDLNRLAASKFRAIHQPEITML